MKVVDINEINFEEEVLEYKGIAVVKFYGSWCGPCKMLASVLDEMKDAMDTASVDPAEFAAYCVSNEETGEGGIRYSELIALCVSEIQRLSKQVEELENKLNTTQND